MVPSFCNLEDPNVQGSKCVLVAQSCPTLCDPMDCSPPGSFVHEIFQARILEWVATFFSRRSSQPRDRTWVSHVAGRLFTIRANDESVESLSHMMPAVTKIYGDLKSSFIV